MFGLVHGAWHGAWCWDLVREELHRRGHRSVAVDLPTEDPDAGAGEYADVVVEALDGETADDLVLVGHSYGGLTVPVAAERLQERGHQTRMVLVAPLLPYPGRSSDQLDRDDPDRLMPGLRAGQLAGEDGSTRWQPQAAIAALYPDAPSSLAQWAASRLRCQQWRISREITPLRRWPRGEVSVIACAGDGVVNADWVRRTAKVRLGVVARMLPGDHSPFLARPAALVDLLTAD